MITQLIGQLVEKTPTTLVIDCNGIGYEVHISLHTFSQIRDKEKIKLYTHHQIREDAHTLFGFHSLLERSIFRLLLSVSGIGAAIARTMLSSLAPQEIHAAIINEDLATIKGIKGIGLKTAQRVLIELKDKMLQLYESEQIPLLKNNTIKEEALSALTMLGFSKNAIEKVLDKELQKGALEVEELVKRVLKKM